MKTKKSVADAQTAQVTNLQEVQKGKRFPLAQKAVTEVTDIKPIEEKPEDTPVVIQPQQEEKPIRKELSMQEYKTRIEKLHELTIKHNKLSDRLKEVEIFEIKKDESNASVRLWDGNGVSFVSSEPESMKKVLTVIKDSYVSQIEEIENQVFDLMAV